MTEGTVRSRRLVLRPWRVGNEEEARSLFALAAEPSIGLNAGWPPHRSVEESMGTIADILHGEGSFAVTLRDGGALVGSIALKPMSGYIDDAIRQGAITRSVDAACRESGKEIGYWIGMPYQGNGYATEAVRLLCSHAFERMDVPAVWGVHYRENIASQRVMDACGFAMVGELSHAHFPLIDRYHDIAVRLLARRRV